MDFLDHIFLDNSIKSYCIVGGLILLVLLFKRFLSRYIASILFRATKRIWKDMPRKSFVDLVLEPLEWLLLILITVFAIDKLNFPDDWHYKIYGHDTEEILSRAGMGIIIISFTWFLLRIIDFIALVLEQKAIATDDKADDQLIIFFRDFLKVLIALLGLLLLIKACFNQPIGTLLTSLSIVGAVLALAAKESLENLIASFIIFFDKPFTTGDFLKVNNVSGTVERIGLRSTRIRTVDKTLVTVPNKQMVDSIVDNHSMRTHRRAEMRIELQPNTALAKVQQVVAAVRTMMDEKSAQFTSHSVFLTDLSRNGLSVTVEFLTQPVTMDLFNQLKEEINIAIKNILEENQAELATTGSSVTIIGEAK